MTQAREKANHSSKKKTEGIKERGKKYSIVEKPKAVGHFLIHFCACLGQNVLNAILVARTASRHVTNAFSTRLKLIWSQSSFKTTKMSKKKTILAKSSRCQWVKINFQQKSKKSRTRVKIQFRPYFVRW